MDNKPTVSPAPPRVNIAQNPTTAPTVNKTAQLAVDEEIVAAPLIDPDFTQNVKAKNPAMSLRWVLRGMEMHSDGSGRWNTLRFEKALTQGYTVATAADLINPPMAYARDNGTKFINGDLILMIIPSKKYKGAILHREQQSAKAVAAVQTGARAAATQEILKGGQALARSKTNVFDPNLSELRGEFKGVEGAEEAFKDIE